MRVPVLNSDLPLNFNKVAKYLGRHWPTGKLGLNKSRETLAYLFGYNSIHELNTVANNETLPSQVEMQRVYASMVGKALYKFSVRPDQLMTVLYRTPFKELAFYKITDYAMEQQLIDEQRKKGHFFFKDEMTNLNAYKSPTLILEQNSRHQLPKYSYAVRPDHTLFASSQYEKTINYLGDIDATVQEIGNELTVEDFVHHHISPLAWISVEDYVDHKDNEGEYRWRTPYMVTVYHAKVENRYIGYMLYHSGLNAYFPVVFNTNDALIKGLIKLYKGECLVHDSSLPSSKVSLSHTFNSKLPTYEIMCQTCDFSNCEEFVFAGQQLIRDEPFSPYVLLYENPILRSLNWEYSVAQEIDENLINNTLYNDHVAIRNTRRKLEDNAIEQVNNLSETLITQTLKTAFRSHSITFDEILQQEYDDDYELPEECEQRWQSIGEEVLIRHPELVFFFDVLALGNIYCDYQEFIMGERLTHACYERDTGFLGYALSKAPRLTSSRNSSADDLFAGVLVLACFSQNNSDYTMDQLERCFNQIIKMLSLWAKQEREITNLETYTQHLKDHDPLYVTHGEAATYQEVSNNEYMQKLSRVSRKFHAGLSQATQATNE